MVDTLKIIEKYYQNNTDLYHILVTHCMSVRDKALGIIDKHTELKLDREFVSDAAMLHDIGIFLCDAPKIKCFGTHQYIEHGYLGAELLRSEGLNKYALVCERHTGVGLSLQTIAEKQLPLPQKNLLPVSMEEQLICYADKFFSKTRLDEENTIDTIQKHLDYFGKENFEKFLEWHQVFG